MVFRVIVKEYKTRIIFFFANHLFCFSLDAYWILKIYFKVWKDVEGLLSLLILPGIQWGLKISLLHYFFNSEGIFLLLLCFEQKSSHITLRFITLITLRMKAQVLTLDCNSLHSCWGLLSELISFHTQLVPSPQPLWPPCPSPSYRAHLSVRFSAHTVAPACSAFILSIHFRYLRRKSLLPYKAGKQNCLQSITTSPVE